ncbi:tungsten ABC transporter substrate-binding protein, partial [Clostridium botulinum]|nr:tungsten ABC transporter substrate-binding protein [Clostridium botulinum]
MKKNVLLLSSIFLKLSLVACDKCSSTVSS